MLRESATYTAARHEVVYALPWAAAAQAHIYSFSNRILPATLARALPARVTLRTIATRLAEKMESLQQARGGILQAIGPQRLAASLSGVVSKAIRGFSQQSARTYFKKLG